MPSEKRAPELWGRSGSTRKEVTDRWSKDEGSRSKAEKSGVPERSGAFVGTDDRNPTPSETPDQRSAVLARALRFAQPRLRRRAGQTPALLPGGLGCCRDLRICVLSGLLTEAGALDRV